MSRAWIVLAAVLTLSLTTSSPAQPDRGHRFDFENGIPDELEIMDATLVSDRRFVVSGKQSLAADFTQSDGDWHEFLHTGESIHFEKGKRYAVRFRFGVLSNESPEIEFYSQLRSRSGKGDISGPNWRWRWPTGYEGHINRLFDIPDDGGYFLMIGARKKGAIVIDDLEIWETSPNEPATRVIVHTHDSRITAERDEFERQFERDQLGELMEDMLVVVLNEGAGGKAQEKKDQIARDFQLDFVDWNVFGELAKTYGVRSSAGGCEYQEYYKFEGSGSPQQRDRVWENRYRQFASQGFTITLDNTYIADESWGQGGYFMCHNGRNWHRHFLQTFTEAANRYLALTQDNIACSVFNRVQGCYCGGCEAQFRTFLDGRFSSRDLKAMGVDNLKTFSIQDYIVMHGLTGQAAVEDALVRAYMKFQYVSGILAWADCVDKAKRVAARQRRVLPCGGNQINIWGSWPYAVTLSQFCDFVEVEELVGVKEKVKRRTLQYKLGAASGHHLKPVIVRGPVTDDTQKKMPMLSTAWWTIHFAEALSNGGVRAFSLGLNKPYTGEPDVPDYMDDPKLYQRCVEFAKWMHAHRAVLTHRESLADVALVYSLPTLIFRQYSALGIPGEGRLPEFERMADLLDENGIAYDVVVLGHPEMWDDTPSFERLKSRYSTIVLPSVDCMTNDQILFFKELENAGTTIFADLPVTFDENMNRRSRPIPMTTADTSDEHIVRIARRHSRVTADAPSHVTVNGWVSCRGGSLDVHLVNFDADLQRDAYKPVANIPVALLVLDGFRVSRCLLSRFGRPDEEIEFRQNGDSVEATVPELESYAIISFTDDDSIEKTQQRMELRRQEDRREVQALAERFDLY